MTCFIVVTRWRAGGSGRDREDGDDQGSGQGRGQAVRRLQLLGRARLPCARQVLQGEDMCTQGECKNRSCKTFDLKGLASCAALFHALNNSSVILQGL